MTSNNYDENNKYLLPDSIEDKSSLKRYLGNVCRASEIRKEEAIRIVECSKGKTILMGDINDVSGSSCMKVFEDAGFIDTWWKGGFGYGATIHYPLPFRIDHILCREGPMGLKVKSTRRIDAKGLSDHDALVAESYLE